MTRGIDDVDPVLGKLFVHTFPETGGSGGGNRNTPLLLLFHPVHNGGAVMHFTDLVRDAGVIEHTLGGRSLASVDVRHDPDISVAFDGRTADHGVVLKKFRGLPAVM